MKAGLASFSVSDALRTAILRKQAELAKTQTEMTSGTVADTGLALGAKTGRLLSLQRESGAIGALIDTNKLVTARLAATQTALGTIADAANAFQKSLVSAQGDTTSFDTLVASAKSALGALTGALGTSSGGQFVFGGIATGQRPVADYDAAGGSSAKSAVDAAFASAFGMGQDDPAVSSIGASALEGFLDGSFADGFGASGWAANWSTASDQPIKSTIATGQTADTSVTANEPALRKLAMAYTMVANLGGSGMADGARQALVTKAVATIADGLKGLTALQARVGTMQTRVSDASDALGAQQTVLTQVAGSLTDVDPYETASRVSELKTQLETAYSLTATLQNLSLVKYL